MSNLPTAEQVIAWEDALFKYKESKASQKVPSETSYYSVDTYDCYTLLMHDFDVREKNCAKVILTWVLRSKDGAFEDTFEEVIPFEEIIKFADA